MRLYIIRHADPDYDNKTITEGGHLEAKALANRLKHSGVDHIYSSPLGRAQHTMAYTANLMNIEPITLEWLKELNHMKVPDAPWGYSAAWDVPAENVFNEMPAPSHENWHKLSYYTKIDAKKTFEKLCQESDRFLESHGYKREGKKYKIIKSNEEKIAVFCHGGFGLTWLAHLLNIPVPLVWSGFWLPPSSVTTILFDQRSEAWAVPRCIGMGDVSHLYESGLEIKPRGIKKNFY